MAGAKYKELILETIDQLRKRKARADLERICVMLMRKHGLSFEDIVLDLEKLVEDNIVLKVEYKGNVSYRNATSRKKYSSLDTKENLKRILEAFNKISSEVDEHGKTDPHVSVDLLEGWLLEHDTEIERDAILLCVQKLIEGDSLIETEGGLYILNEGSQIKNKTVASKTDFSSVKLKAPKEKMDQTVIKIKQKPGPKGKKMQSTQKAYTEDSKSPPGETGADNKTPSPGKKGRAPTKRKRIKKTHGPDFETYFVPCKASRRRDSSVDKREEKIPLVKVSPSSSRGSSDATCDFCLKTAESNKNGHGEELLFCKDCSAKAHPSCMEYSEDLARRARTSPWQCIDCKTCYICEDSGDADAMLFCDACDKGYHMDCHDPPITEKPTGKWVCTRCIEQDERESESKSSAGVPNGSMNGDSNSTLLPTPRESPVDYKPPHVIQSMPSLPSQPCSHSTLLQILPSFKRYTNKAVPDATLWSIKEVVDFFTDAGFNEEASVFLEQEIDGKSLLLMKRSDVLQGLSLKLGPALKIYAHIQRLQTKGQLII